VRTTVNLDDDVAQEVERLRRERGLGLSEAVNELARSGMSVRRTRARKRFRQSTSAVGMRIDVSNIGDVLDVLDA
jgi:metal-responsive CopG/Arc/MetJ family transcriptional regulator